MDRFERHRTNNPDLERIQDNVERAVDRMGKRVVLKGLAFPGGGGTIEVKHPLGRAPSAWYPIRVQGAAFAAFESASTDKAITFTSANACTVDLVVE